jgi:hypothetical protein
VPATMARESPFHSVSVHISYISIAPIGGMPRAGPEPAGSRMKGDYIFAEFILSIVQPLPARSQYRFLLFHMLYLDPAPFSRYAGSFRALYLMAGV